MPSVTKTRNARKTRKGQSQMAAQVVGPWAWAQKQGRPTGKGRPGFQRERKDSCHGMEVSHLGLLLGFLSFNCCLTVWSREGRPLNNTSQILSKETFLRTKNKIKSKRYVEALKNEKENPRPVYNGNLLFFFPPPSLFLTHPYPHPQDLKPPSR